MAVSALQDAHAFSFSNLVAVGHGDLDADSTKAKDFYPGGIFFANSPFGPRLIQYIQNRSTSAVVQGALVSSLGDNDGKTQITTSGAAAVNTTTKMTTSGLTASAHVGGLAHVVNSVATGTGLPPEGETSVVVSNTATVVMVDANLPFSATITSGDTVDLRGMYNAEAAAAGDLAYVVLGVVIGRNGIAAGNYGWVQKQGLCPNALIKASTALTQNDALIADTGRLGPAAGGSSAANLQVGTAAHVMNNDSTPDKSLVLLTLGFGFTPGTVDASA